MIGYKHILGTRLTEHEERTPNDQVALLSSLLSESFWNAWYEVDNLVNKKHESMCDSSILYAHRVFDTLIILTESGKVYDRIDQINSVVDGRGKRFVFMVPGHTDLMSKTWTRNE